MKYRHISQEKCHDHHCLGFCCGKVVLCRPPSQLIIAHPRGIEATEHVWQEGLAFRPRTSSRWWPQPTRKTLHSLSGSFPEVEVKMQITYLKPPPSHAFEDAYWKETTGPHEPCQGPQTSDIIQVTRWALESWAFHYGLPVVKEHNIGGAHPTWAKFFDYRYQAYWSCPSCWRYLHVPIITEGAWQ